MSIKKLALITTLASAFFLTGCDNNKTTVTENKPEEPAKVTTLKVGVISGPEQEVQRLLNNKLKISIILMLNLSFLMIMLRQTKH